MCWPSTASWEGSTEEIQQLNLTPMNMKTANTNTGLTLDNALVGCEADRASFILGASDFIKADLKLEDLNFEIILDHNERMQVWSKKTNLYVRLFDFSEKATEAAKS